MYDFSVGAPAFFRNPTLGAKSFGKKLGLGPIFCSDFKKNFLWGGGLCLLKKKKGPPGLGEI